MPWHRVAITLAIGLVVGCAAAALQLAHARSIQTVYDGGTVGGPLFTLEAEVQDLALAARTPASYVQVSGPGQVPVAADPRQTILLVAIDERTIAELGAYNGGYPRAYHAAVLEELLRGPPRVVAFDLGFFEPTADDARLAAAIQQARQLPVPTRVVLAGVGLVPAGARLSRGPNGELRFDRGLAPVPALLDAADVGLANVLPDERGTIRAMPLVSLVGDTERPSLALAAVAAYLRRPRPIDARPRPDVLEIAGRQVPVDGASAVRINFFGPPSPSNSPTSTFQVLSFVDVLRGRVDPALFRGKLVLIGASGAAGLADEFWTPVSREGQRMAGVEIHANVAATLLSTQFLHSAPLWSQLALTFGLAIGVAFATVRLGVAWASVSTALVLAAVTLASVWLLYAFGVEVPLVTPLLAGIVAYGAVVAWRVSVEQRQSRALLRALAAVVPPSVAQQIARAPGRVQLGGERRPISVLFTDLHDFTAFSESVSPEVLSGVMSEYLAAMTAVVFEHGGTLDKFIGDAVMAFWNAPLDDPDHARHACETILVMQAQLAQLNTRWAARGLPAQRMRVGLHSGPASVGNLGTPRRFAYTALGDTVNLAARLEPLNNVYGTVACISQATLDAAGSSFLVRYLDRVTVVGRSAPVEVYELLGRAADTALTARWTPLLSAYHRGVQAYQAREFASAATAFRAALILEPADAPSAQYLARCVQLETTPPPVDWDGALIMAHK